MAMISFDESIALLETAVLAADSEPVAIDQASGRWLAEAVVAQISSPAADVSAMDGYALGGDGPAVCRVVGASYPGNGHAGEVRAGEAVRIFTGAPLPLGTDRIAIQEDVVQAGNLATIPATPAGAHVRRAGSDFKAGDRLIAAGTRLSPGGVLTAAGADLASVKVAKRPRVAIIATGDELVEPGSARALPGRIPESVAAGVAALARLWGGDVVHRDRVGDDLPRLEEAGRTALALADLVIVTGGASVGERDFGKTMFGDALDLIFSKVAIKPGKPVSLGRVGERLVLGLPGNPSSAMVTARLFLAPLLAAMQGGGVASALAWRREILAGPVPATGDRETMIRARRTADGILPLDSRDSGAQAVLAGADMLIRRTALAPSGKAGESAIAIDF